MTKLLFVGGPPRSGTTALAEYLNRHPGVLICMERYKWVPPHEMRPELFAFERILDYRMSFRGDREETNTPREHHVELLKSKDPERLEWIGDKTPAYVEILIRLSENNPGASFIVTYRPLEEVAESFEARSQDPDDPWRLGGFEDGVGRWNAAMRSTREFVESARNLNVLILDYHDFFYDNRSVVPLLSRFLGVEIDEETQEAWERMTRNFEANRRPKEPLNERQRAFIEAERDAGAERWVLDRIRRQRWELEAYPADVARALVEERRLSAVRVAQERTRARRLRERAERLQEEKEDLERQIREARSQKGGWFR